MSIKRIACIFALIFVWHVSTDAFASRARLLVMGSGDSGILLNGSGSLYYEDSYNVFYNPSYVSDFSDWGTIEKSNGNGGAQAGFVSRIILMYFGMFMNRTSGLTGAYSGSMKPLDLMVGADMGFKWGVGVTYGRADSKNQNFTVRAGTQFDEIAPFLAMTLRGDGQTGGVDYKNNHSMGGIRYRWGEWIPYFGFRQDKTTLTGTETKLTTLGVGFGRNSRISESVSLNYSIGYWNTQQDSNASKALFPVDISVEGDPSSWVTLRGGFAYRQSSSARMGATFHVSKVDFDWAVGSSDGTENLDSTSFDLTQGFFTAASLSYKW